MKKIILGIMVLMMGVGLFGVLSVPVMAAEKSCVETTELMSTDKCKADANGKLKKKPGGDVPCSCDDGKGSSVMSVLNLAVEFMTIGVGILGVLGITIVGIQYLTAGGNEEQTRKAKRRMFEIVIGIAVYVVIYALLYWLLPGFKPF